MLNLQIVYRNLSRCLPSFLARNEGKNWQFASNITSKEEPHIDIGVEATEYIKFSKDVCYTLKTGQHSTTIIPIWTTSSTGSSLLKIAADKGFSLNNCQSQYRKIPTTMHSNAGLKTYSHNYIKSKKMRQNNANFRTEDNKSFLYKIRKFFRETINIKTNKMIMNKSNSCYFKSMTDADNSINDNFQISTNINDTACKIGNNIKINGIFNSNWKAKNIDPELSSHILKQTEKREPADPTVSLNSPNYPYIPCPLKQVPSTNFVINGPYQSYKHISLAPMFTLDSVIVNKLKNGKKLVKEAKDKENRPCIRENFWSQYLNNQVETDQQICHISPPLPKTAAVSETSTNDYGIIESGFTKRKNTGISGLPINSEDKAKNDTKNKSVPSTNMSTAKGEINNTLNRDQITPLKPVVLQPKTEEPSTNPDEPRLIVNNNFNKAAVEGETKVKLSSTIPQKTKLDENKSKQAIHARYFIENKGKEVKHLNLNCAQSMPYVQSPSQIKSTNNRENKVVPKVITKKSEINLMKQKIEIPNYKKNKILQDIKKFYVKPTMKEKGITGKFVTNQLQTKIEKEKSKLKTKPTIKSQYPLTSPSTLKKKE